MSAQARAPRSLRVAPRPQAKARNSTSTSPLEATTTPNPPNQAVANSELESTRLYVQPLTTELLPSVLGASLLPHVRDLFLTSPGTFPENTYGFVTLPTESARRLRNKLHNTTFQGVKLRVEEARSDKKKGSALLGATEMADLDASDKRERRSSRRNAKEDPKTLSGREIQQGKHVKRGWTGGDTAQSRKRRKSGEQGEMLAPKVLFRTKLPHAPAKTSAPDETTVRKDGTTIIKEFENTTKYPSFLKDSSDQEPGKAATAYVEGKGWVDDAGNIVEAVRKSRRTRSQKAADDDERQSELDKIREEEENSNSSQRRESESTPETYLSPPRKEPSALEALFKRPSPKTSGRGSRESVPESIDTAAASFAFFDSTEPESAALNAAQVSDQHASKSSTAVGESRRRLPARKLSLLVPPQTPFTRRDLEDRALRSAAPTPDTAAIGRRFRAPWRHTSRGTASTRSMSGSVEPDGSLEGPFHNSRRDRSSSLIIKQEAIDNADVLMRDGDDFNLVVNGPGALAVSVETTETALPDQATPEQASDDESQSAAEGADKHDIANGKEERDEFEQRWYEERGKLNRSWKARKRELKKNARQRENRRGKPRS